MQDIGRVRRRALRAVAAQFFVNGFTYATILPRLPDVRARVDVSTGTLGAILMIGAVAGVLGSLLAGTIVGRLGTRTTMIVASVLAIAGLPVVGLARDPAILAAGLFVVAFFDVFADVAMNVQGSVLSSHRDAPVMNRLHGIWSLATVVGGLLAVAMAALGVDVAVHMILVAVVLLGAELILGRFLSPVDEDHAHDDGADEDPDGGVDETVPGLGVPVSDTGVGSWSTAALLLGVGAAAAMIMEVGPGDWAAIRLSDDLSAGGALAAAAFVAFTAGMTVGRFGGDWVQLRLGLDRLLLSSSIVAAIGLALATSTPNAGAALAGFALAGVGVSVQFPQLYDQAARLPGPPGSGFTDLLIGQRIAAVLTPVVIGALAGVFSVGTAVAMVTLPAAFVTIALAVARPRRSRPSPASRSR